MQTVSRYLLSQLVIAYVSGYHGRNSKVYDRRLTLHRGVSNPVNFTFKNEDQKTQDITSKTYEFNMIDTESKKAVLTKTLTILDDGSTVSTKGDASCTITEGDLLPLDSAYPEFVPSTTVSSFTGSGGPLAYTSGSIDARPGINNNKALHTIAVYTKNFSGSLRVQGTMSASPSNTDYFDITMDGAGALVNLFSDSTTVTNFNFTGVYHSVRFSWGNDSGNTGVIDKILYRQ